MPTFAVIISAMLGTIGAGLAALSAYLVATRKASGRIGTSEASSLWEAAEIIRKELYERVKEQNVEMQRLNERISAAEGREERCQADLQEAREQLALVRERLAVLEDHNEHSA